LFPLLLRVLRGSCFFKTHASRPHGATNALTSL
jgi:hypothetical protein